MHSTPNFDSSTDVFAIMIAFCETANPVRIRKEAKDPTGMDFRPRNAGMVFEDDRIKNYVLTEIRSSLAGISPGLTRNS